MTKKEFIAKWDKVTKLHMFEICLNEYINGLKEQEYAIFDLWIDDKTDKFHADNISIDIDYDFSLDANLQALFDEVISAISDNPEEYI